jgi:hypothetical protein
LSSRISWRLFVGVVVLTLIFIGIWILEYLRNKSDSEIARWASIATVVSVLVSLVALGAALLSMRPAKAHESGRQDGDAVTYQENRTIGAVQNYIEIRAEAAPQDIRHPPESLLDQTLGRSGKELISPSRPMLRVKRVTEYGESHEIEIFDVSLAEKWISSNPWGHRDSIGPVDE